MLLAGILITWAVFVAVFLFVWARLHQIARFQDGIDEEAYVNGWTESPPSSADARRSNPNRHARTRLTLAAR